MLFPSIAMASNLIVFSDKHEIVELSEFRATNGVQAGFGPGTSALQLASGQGHFPVVRRRTIGRVDFALRGTKLAPSSKPCYYYIVRHLFLEAMHLLLLASCF